MCVENLDILHCPSQERDIFLWSCCWKEFLIGLTFNFYVFSSLHPMTLGDRKQSSFCLHEGTGMVKEEGWISAIKLLLLIVSGIEPSTCSPLPRDGGGMPTHPTFPLLTNTANIFPRGNYNNSPPLPSPLLHPSTFWKKKVLLLLYIFQITGTSSKFCIFSWLSIPSSRLLLFFFLHLQELEIYSRKMS